KSRQQIRRADTTTRQPPHRRSQIELKDESAARRPESARAAHRFRQVALFPLHSLIPRDDHLGNPVSRMYLIRSPPEIEQNHLQLSPVARIDGRRRVW